MLKALPPVIDQSSLASSRMLRLLLLAFESLLICSTCLHPVLLTSSLLQATGDLSLLHKNALGQFK